MKAFDELYPVIRSWPILPGYTLREHQTPGGPLWDVRDEQGNEPPHSPELFAATLAAVERRHHNRQN